MKSASTDIWDAIKGDLDPDIREAFEAPIQDGKDVLPSYAYVNSPHLTAVMLQCVREVQKANILNRKP